MASAGDLTIELDLDTADFRRSMQTVQDSISNAGSKLTKIGSGMKNVGSKLTAGLTLPLVGVGLTAVKIAADFEAGMSEVQAISGATGEELTKLKDAAKAMGASTKFSATESAEALNFLALAGYDVEKSIATLPKVLDLAAAGGLEIGYTADVVTDSMSALGLETKDLDTFVDQLAKTSQKTNTKVGQLGEAILTVGGTAKGLSGGITEMNLNLGLLADNGVKGSEGGTALRNMILSLSAPTKKAAKILKNLGVETLDSDKNLRNLNDIMSDLDKSTNKMGTGEKAGILAKVFNKTDLKSVNALLGTSKERVLELTTELEGSKGAAKKMADTMQDNLSGQLTKLKSALEGVAIQIGEILIPVLKDVVEKYIAPMIEKFSNLSPSMKKVIVVVAVLAAVLGPLIAFIGMIITGVGALIPVITAISLPMIAWVVGIVAVIAALVYLWKNNKEFKNKVLKIWNNIKGFLVKTFEYIKTFAMAIWNTLKEFWWKNGKEITDTFMKIWNSVVDFLGSAFTIIIGIVKIAADIILGLWNLLGNDILNYVTNAFKRIGQVISGAFDIITGILDIFIGLFTGDWDKMWEGVKKVASGVVEVLTGIFGGLIDIVTGVWDFITGGPDKAEIEVKAKKAAKAEASPGIKDALNAYDKKTAPIFDIEESSIAKSGAGMIGMANPLKLATGGIVTRPTLAMIGEGGESEAVIPLSKLGEMGGGGVVINITGNNITDTMDVDIIANRIMNKLKVAGTY